MKVPLKLSNNSTYYNFSKAMSYNPGLIICIGGRGIGKTTGALIEAISEYNKNETQFIYVRRYKTELKKFVSKNTLNEISDAITTKGDGSGGYIFQCMGVTIGYGIALSTASGYKSVSFPKVNLVIGDEMILPRGGTYHYLNDDVACWFEFLSTVYRTRTGGHNIILGNNADLFNPYFEFFNIPTFIGIYYDKDRGLYCELAENSPNLKELEEKTAIYKLIKNTPYGDYHYGNKVLTDTTRTLGDKPLNARLIFRMIVDNITINSYLYYQEGNLWCYYELKDKVIMDNISYQITNKGKVNYYYGTLLKKKYGNLISSRYYLKQNLFNTDKCNDIVNYIVSLL